MTSDSLEVVVDAQATLGEGPIWDTAKQVLWWIDIVQQKLHSHDPASNTNQFYPLTEMIGTVVPRRQGGLMLALENGLVRFDPDTGHLEFVCDPEADLPGNRFNDGKCDPAGRFWAGTMSKTEQPEAGSLYCLNANGSCEKRLEHLTVANGIVWTADQSTMYYIDSPTRRVDAFDFDLRTGAISHRRTAVEIPDGMGYPDGMAIDRNDNLWVGLWAGWGVGHFDPRSGDLICKLEVPSANVTACAFGGPTLDDLFITTARDRAGDLEKQPRAGALFRARVGVAGVPSFAYAG